MEKLKFKGNNFHQYVKLYGDPNIQPEPEEVYIRFPLGQLGLCRCDDGSYWIHFHSFDIDKNSNPERKGVLSSEQYESRIDLPGEYLNDHLKQKLRDAVNKSDHIAFRVRSLT